MLKQELSKYSISVFIQANNSIELASWSEQEISFKLIIQDLCGWLCTKLWIFIYCYFSFHLLLWEVARVEIKIWWVIRNQASKQHWLSFKWKVEMISEEKTIPKSRMCMQISIEEESILTVEMF
jgi:hypothetical protein